MNELHFCEVPPPAALSRVVECFWAASGKKLTARAKRHRVLPDGCVDIVFTAEQAANGGLSSICSLNLVGTMTRYRDFDLPDNPLTVGVRFHPGGASAYLPFPTSEITDDVVPVSEAWKRDGEEFRETLWTAGSAEGCIAVLRRELLGRLMRGDGKAAPAVDYAVKTIVTNCGKVDLRDLTACLGTSQRNLRRLTKAHSGVSPKRLCRVYRFRRLLRLLREALNPDWADLAIECGYFDQAHMINEFRELSGYTPREWHRTRLDGTLTPAYR